MRTIIAELFLALLLVIMIPIIFMRHKQLSDVHTVCESTDPFRELSTEYGKPSTERDAGEINVLLSDGTVTRLSVNDYLTSVLICEMPSNFELEALKAQAVVARTYVLRQMEFGGKHQGADICDQPSCCQGYCTPQEYLDAGGSEDNLRKYANAVRETDDLVLVYNGQLIEATYFSCSGGQTEDAVAVWGTDIPYLRSVESPGEETASHYTDTVTIPMERFYRILQLEGTEYLLVENIKYTEGGGVDSLLINGKSYKGTQLRTLLGLRSTAFILSVVGENVVVTTKGFGHRVGMSQYGAQAMAQKGFGFEEILEHYYRGTALTSLKELTD